MPPSVNHKNEPRKKNKAKNGAAAPASLSQQPPIQPVPPQLHSKSIEEPPEPSIVKAPLKQVNPVSPSPVPAVAKVAPSMVEPACRGITAKPQPITNSGMVGAVADYIHSAIPMSTSTPTEQPEKIDWVDLQRLQTGGDSSKWIDYIVVGLTRGYQIWIYTEEKTWEEVLSERGSAIRLGKLLPHRPENLYPAQKEDGLCQLRPLLAIVDPATDPKRDEKPFMHVKIRSLRKEDVYLKKLSFDHCEQHVSAIEANNKFLAVMLTSKLFVYDSYHLCLRYELDTTANPDGFSPALSLRDSALAFPPVNADNSAEISCGGLSLEPPKEQSTVAGQVLQVFSRTMTSLNESVSGSGSRPLGIVSIVDLSPSLAEGQKPVAVARFVAHSAPIAHLNFSHDARCLATADDGGSTFHVFLVLPHPTCVGLGAVQHLYRLHRGNTPAKVLSSSWSLDGRWLTLATNHGTSHIFAVSSYGGTPSYRTHSAKFANRESSSFLKSAGHFGGTMLHTAKKERTHSGSTLTDKKHVALGSGPISCAALNSRVGPYEPTITLYTSKKIRESSLSADKISAWASDLTPSALSSGGRRIGVASASRLSVLSSHSALFVARADGLVAAYELRVPPAQTPDEPPKLHVLPLSTWTLTRTKKNEGPRVPLPMGSALLQAMFDEERATRKTSLQCENWIPEVETQPYSSPHRRLWQGPQFSFYCYNEENTPSLVPPAQRVVPINIGSSGGREDMLEATRIECGSWSSQKDRTSLTEDNDEVARAISEAMREMQTEERKEEERVSDDEFFDTASGAGIQRKEDDNLLRFDEDDD